MNTPSSTRVPAALVAGLAGILLASGCGVIDRLTSAEDFAIQRFTVDQQTVSPGTAVMLSWDVEGADSVEIDNGLGRVAAKGSKQLRPETSATYMLTARAGTSVATAAVQVVVRGSTPPPAPFPSPTPSPTPTPTPSPSPTPSPTPPPGSDPPSSDRPTPSCGSRSAAFGSCPLSVAKGAALTSGECIELTSISFDSDCPVAFATPRKLEFEVTARVGTSKPLTWRRARTSADVLTPATGTLDPQGTTSVQIDDLALSTVLVIEVVEGERVLLTFTVGHD